MADDNSDSISQIDPDELMRRVMGGDSSWSKPGDAPINGSQPSSPDPYTRPGKVPMSGTQPRNPGAALTQPAAPANSAPPMPSIGFDPSKLPDALRPRPMGMDVVPQAPVGANNDARMAWTKKLEQDQTPNDPSAKQYRMGTGARVLGTVGNFLQGFGGKPFTPTYTGPGATNSRFAKDESLRTQNIAKDTSQLGEQEKLDSARQKMNEDLVKQVYEGQLGQARMETAAAQQSKAETASQQLDIKKIAVDNAAKFNEEKTQTALRALDEKARRDDQLAAMGKDVVEARKQNAELAIQFRQQQLDYEKKKFEEGLGAKSLDAELKGRLDAIEKRYHDHPYRTMFDDKDAEIKIVNDDINSRRLGGGASTGAPATGTPKPTAPPQSTPAKGYTRIKASDGQMHDIPSKNLAAAKQRDPKLQVIQ